MGKLFRLTLLTLLAFCNAEIEDENCIIQDYEGTQCIITIKCPYIVTAENLNNEINKRKIGCRDNDDYKIIYQLKNIIMNEDNIKTLESLNNVNWKRIIKFELTNGNLSVIPKGIYKAIDLQELNLSFNKFGTLPDLNVFKNLKKINLSHNLIDNKIDLKLFKKFTSLDVSNNLITTIELGSEEFEITLEYLNFSGNQLTTVPDFTNYTRLQILDLSHNKINTRLDFKLVKGLTSLNFSNNFITNIDVGNEDSQIKIKDLDCSYNNLTTFPDFTNFTKLKKLDLSHNMIETQVNLLPLKYVISLNISNNLIPTVQVGTNDIQFALENLYCSHNKLKTIPDFTNYTKLVNMDLSFNMIDTEINFESLKNLTSLNVSNNFIPNIEIGSDDSQFNLEELDCSHNNLTKMPNFTNFMNLKLLNLSHNMISTDVNLDHLKNLTSLIVSKNLIPKIKVSSEDSQFNLEYLDCSHNALTAVPDFTSYTKLVKLNVSHNAIGVDFDFKALKNLISLDVSNNHIQYIEISRDDSKFDLAELDCSHNELTVFPDFTNFTKLKKLDLSHNMIETQVNLLPLKYVISLNISNNLIATVQVETNDIQFALENLYCSHNKLKTIPDFTNYTKLVNMDLSFNMIDTEINFESLKYLTSLNVSNNFIPNIEIGSDDSQFNLEELDCSHNNLTKMPNFTNFMNLKLLNLSHNMISTDVNLDHLKNLTSLIVSKNLIPKIKVSSEDSQFNLEYLDCSHNALTAVPDFTSYTKLVKLNVSHNAIGVDFDFKALKNLISLDVSNNHIQYIEISRDDSKFDLAELDCSHNELTVFPDFTNFTKLKKLDLSHNMIETQVNLLPLKYVISLNISNNLIPTVQVGTDDIQFALENLYCSHNKLKTIPDFTNYTKLVNMDLSFNMIDTEINFGSLKYLTSLNVSNNFIPNIEIGSGDSQFNLEEFDCSHNTLTKMPNFTNFMNLKLLTLSHNMISTDVNLDHLKNLTSLIVSKNLIPKIKVSSEDSQFNLEYLDCSHNALTAVPDFTSYTKLVKLNVSHNAIGVDFDFKALKNLISLDVSNNHIQYIEISRDDSKFDLAELDCSHNELTVFPDFTNFTKLKKLDLSNNMIKTQVTLLSLKYVISLYISNNLIPAIQVGSDNSQFALENLYCSHNKLATIPDFTNYTKLVTMDLSFNMIDTEINFESLKYLTSLNVSNNFIPNIEIGSDGSQYNLEELDCSHNNLTKMPKFTNFMNLKLLNLSHNMISTDVNLDHLKNLTSLIVSKNLIPKIKVSSEDSQFNLEYLDCSHNALTAVPDFTSYTKLVKLNVSHNAIVVDFDFKALKNLISLDVSNNHIQYIEISRDDSKFDLAELDCSHNELTVFPDFTNFTKLKKLDLSHNMIKTQVTLLPLKYVISLNISNNLIPAIQVGSDNSQFALENLYCSHNKLATIPDFTNYTKLVNMDLSFNMIDTEINFGSLKYLTSLNVSNNFIPNIEIGSGDTQFNLEEFDCSHNNLTKMPNFTNFMNLKLLTLSHNMISTDVNLDHLKNLTSLNVSNNFIPNIEIGSGDSQFNLEEFDCSHNNLTKMPNFTNFMNLKLLTLSHNMISTDVNLDHLKNLTSLIVSKNLIPKIKVSSEDSRFNLEYLDCSHNALTAVPDFTSYTKLVKLNVSHNAIVVDFDFKALKNLISLDVSNNLIPQIKTGIDDSKFDLEELDCSNNKLTVVPQFTNFTKLKKLDLSHNMITDVHLKPIKNVAKLKLSNNFISDLVVESEEFYFNLEELDCSSNKLRVSPDFSKLIKLKILDLSRNKISTEVNLKPLNVLTTLIASQNHIPKIDFGSENMHLNYIDLSHNKIKEIPILNEFQTVKLLNLSNNLIEGKFVISDFKSVIAIDFSYNNISVLGYRRDTKKIYTEVIKLAKNKIQSIPNFYFENCVQLKKLDLSQNSIDGKLSIAQFLGMSSLEELVLSNNFIQELGDAFLNFEHLSTLLLDFNRIQFISNNTFDVTINLTTLDLSSNKIQTINNDAFASLNKLDKLNLSYNNLTKIEKQMLQNNYNLAKLDVSHNIINIIEPKSFQNNKIHEFSFANNNLFSPLNGFIFDGLLVSELDLSNTNIMEIQPEYFNHLGKTLERLYLTNNNLTDVSGIPFEKMNVLKLLDLSNNKLIAVPGSIVGTNETTRHKRDVLESTSPILDLNLSKNKIKKIGGKEFNKYRFIKRFNCSYCSIEYVDEQAFSEVYSLQNLDLSHNSLSKFDVDVSSIKFIQELYLNDNNLINIDIIKNLHYLQKINLARNNIKEIDLETFTPLINLSLINLSSNKHLVITSHFENLPNLERVIVSKIKEVNFRKTKNTSIKIINLSSSGIKNLSSVGVNHIHNLESLNLQDNKIFDIDTDTFKGMKYLTELNLGGNDISEIKSETFKDCVQLEWLNLRKNNLKSVKSSFDGLENLKTLILSRNEITIIENSSFVKNSNLQILDLQKNKLSYIYQYAFIGLTNLELLNLKDNRLHNFGPWYLPSNKTEVAVLLDNNLITSILFEEFANTYITMLSIGGNPIPNDQIYKAKQKFPNLNIRDKSYLVSVGRGKNVNSAKETLGSIKSNINNRGVSPTVADKHEIITEISKIIISPRNEKTYIIDTTKEPDPIVVSSQSPLEHVLSTENNLPYTEEGLNLNQGKTILSKITLLKQKINKKDGNLNNIDEILKSSINDKSYLTLLYVTAVFVAITIAIFVIKAFVYIRRQARLLNK